MYLSQNKQAYRSTSLPNTCQGHWLYGNAGMDGSAFLRLQDGLLVPDLSAILSPVASGDAGGSSAKNSEVDFLPSPRPLTRLDRNSDCARVRLAG